MGNSKGKLKPYERIITEREGGGKTSLLRRPERITAEKTVCILLVRGENPAGEPLYAYVAVKADRLEEFMEAQRSGMFYPEDFGVIVESGLGQPPEEIRRKMEVEYGFDHERMADIPDAATAHHIVTNLLAPHDPDVEET